MVPSLKFVEVEFGVTGRRGGSLSLAPRHPTVRRNDVDHGDLPVFQAARLDPIIALRCD